LGADALFIRAQSVIRADGFSSAQYRYSAIGKPGSNRDVQNPGPMVDLQGLSAYQNIQGARSARTVDSLTRLG
jgi:hypothetical protein